MAVQASQPERVAHTSPALHSEGSQFQSPQLPASGPLAVPSRHDPAPSPHQPQAARSMHSSQSVADEHGGAPHSSWNQSQSAHDPVLGPANVPLAQVPVLSHHPHPARPVHSPQLA